MPGTFSKSILKVGTYHSPDGVVKVTPERLRHWARETKRLQSVGYAIPSHFDHSNELEELEPIAMDVLDRKQTRSASRTVGKLSDIRVSKDGQSAEIVLETLTPQATEAVKSNSVYVSPVIFPEWKDGAGNSYRDVITSFDLVDHPVDYSQTSFVPAQKLGLVPAIRMGVNTKPFRLGAAMADEEKEYDEFEEDSTDTEGDEGGSDSVPDTSMDEPAEETAPPTPVDTDPTDDIESNAQALGDVIAALQGMNIILPPDTAAGNFLERLHTALLTAQAHQGMGGNPGEMPGEQIPEAASPQIATMSVQQRQRVSKSLTQRIEALLKSGRCKPVEANNQKRALQTVRLSLDSEGNPRKSHIERWIEAREDVPEGTFWSNKQKTSATKLSRVPAPQTWNAFEAISPQEEDALVKEHLKRAVR